MAAAKSKHGEFLHLSAQAESRQTLSRYPLVGSARAGELGGATSQLSCPGQLCERKYATLLYLCEPGMVRLNATCQRNTERINANYIRRRAIG